MTERPPERLHLNSKRELNRRIIAIGAASALVVAGLLLLPWVLRRDTPSKSVSVPELAVAAYSGDAKAAGMLSNMGPAAVPDLIEMLEARDGLARRFIWQQTNAPLPARKYVFSRVGPPSAALYRGAAAKYLGTFPSNAIPAVPALVAALGDEDAAVRLHAAATLGRIGAPAVPALTKAVSMGDSGVKAGALRAITAIREDAAPAIPALIAMLGDTNRGLAISAADVLASIGAPAIPSLVETVRSNKSIERKLALSSLQKMATPLGLRALRDANQHTVEALMSLLSDSEPEARLASLSLLRRMPAKAQAARPQVRKLLSDPDDSVRELAEVVLRTLGKDAP